MSNEATYLIRQDSVQSSGLLSLPWRSNRIPDVGPGEHAYLAGITQDGDHHYERVLDASAVKIPARVSAQIYRVRCVDFPSSVVLSRVLSDDQGSSWDFQVECVWRVVDSRRVLLNLGLELCTTSQPVSLLMAESWLLKRIGPLTKEAHGEYSVQDLQDRNALPASWWQKQLCKWLEPCGFGVTVSAVSWSSAQAEVAEADTLRERELERIVSARRRELDAEVQRAKDESAYQEELLQIESSAGIHDQERVQRAQMLEERHKTKMIQVGKELEDAVREGELAALKHERSMAELIGDLETVQATKAREDASAKQHAEVCVRLGELASTLEGLAGLPEALLAQLASRDETASCMAAERLTSKEFNVSAMDLASLGFTVDRQGLVEALREKAFSDENSVEVVKPDIQTRSISTRDIRTRDIGMAEVKSLPINSCLNFTVRTVRPGYLTLINLGTSGGVHVLVPNAYSPSDQTLVREGESLSIPGSRVLPIERLSEQGLSLVESGPPGWEHVAAIVSETPLIGPSIGARSLPHLPLVKLEPNEIVALHQTLASADPSTWSAGVLSFLVGP